MANGSSWHGVELRHFIALEAIARERSFSAAAYSLGYTQSAISAQVTALERAVGATLFERLPGSRGVELTHEGRVLLDHVAAILARLRTAQADLASLQCGEQTRTLRVGTFQSVATTLLPRAIGALDELPELRELQDVTRLLELLERGELDVTFVTLPLDGGPFEAIELLRDPYVLVARTDRAEECAGEPVAVEDLGRLPLIALERCVPQQFAEDVLRALGVTLNVVARLDDFTSVCALAEAGIGFGLVPSLIASQVRDLEVLAIEERLPPRIIGLAWHRDCVRSAEVERFVAAARGSAAELEPLLV